MVVNPKNQTCNILARIKNQSEYTSISESGPHIYAMSIPSRSYKSLGWGSDNHVRMVKRRKPVYTAVWQRIMRIDDINELKTSTREPGKWSWWALVPFSPMTAPRLCSELFLAIRCGCRFLFLSSTTVTSLSCFSAVSYSCWVSFCDSSPIAAFWLF